MLYQHLKLTLTISSFKSTTCITPLISLCLFAVTSILYAETAPTAPSVSKITLIAINASQQKALGINSAAIESVNRTWNTPYPAKVIVPNTQLRIIGAPLNGLLQSLYVAEGDKVTKGQTLAIIHSPQLLQQQSSYLEALTDLNLATTEHKRYTDLVKDGLIAKRRFLEARTKYIQAKNRVEQHRQTLKLSGMSNTAIKKLQRSHKLSSTLSITAPLSGVVLKQLTTLGSQLNALDPLYKIGHLKPLWLDIHVPLEQLGGIKKGTSVKIIEPEITGKVITIGRMVHGKDQGILIRAEIHQDTEKLFPGQFVQAQTAYRRSGTQRTFRIPRSALVRNEGQTWVFITKKEGFLPSAIDIIKEEASSLVISGQLRQNESIVIAGTAALKATWLENTE